MAPAHTQGRRSRPVQYFEEGKGRRTGVTLKDAGKRDEHGLEPTEGLFSSPIQSTKRTGRKSTGTIVSSEEMEVVDSSAPEPTEVLTERRKARNASSRPLPPPPSRSPIKTSLGATPRRPPSMGPLSSAHRSQTPTAAQDSVSRRLDFHALAERPASVERIAMNRVSRPKMVAQKWVPNPKHPRPDVYDIVQTPESSPELPQQNEQYEEADMQVNGGHDHSPRLGMDDSFQLQQENEAALENSIVQDVPEMPSSKRRRKTRQSIEGNETQPEISVLNEEELEKSAVPDPEQEGDISVERSEAEVEEEAEAEADLDPVPEPESPAQKKKRGRPPGKNSTKAKASASNASRAKAAYKKPAQPSEYRPYVARPLQRLRSETPLEDDGASVTRSGRISYKPLDYWRGERAVFKPNSHLETIDEIIRVEDVTPIKRPRPPQKSQKKRKLDIYEEDDVAEEPWEGDEGVVKGVVRAWDPITGVGIDEEVIEQELALASQVIELRDGADAHFRYAKTMTMPFFGSGIVELPPGGYKRSKNTRKMQMVFFVHLGKVTVEVAGTQFVISKGGVWQVPRGNFYSIQNETEHDAKIFFAQGCEVVLEPVATLTSPAKLQPDD